MGNLALACPYAQIYYTGKGTFSNLFTYYDSVYIIYIYIYIWYVVSGMYIKVISIAVCSMSNGISCLPHDCNEPQHKMSLSGI